MQDIIIKITSNYFADTDLYESYGLPKQYKIPFIKIIIQIYKRQF